MKYVYVVIECCCIYEGYEIIGVFSSKKKAMREVVRRLKEHPHYDYIKAIKCNVN